VTPQHQHIAVDLRCDTRIAALFVARVLMECSEIAGPTVH
jgi:hypothetical protein